MVVKKYCVNRKKDGFLYDPKIEKFFSWGFDIYLNGRRVQERGFLSKTLAEQAVAAAKVKAKQIRHGLKAELSAFLIELFQKKLDTLTGRERTFQKRVFEFVISVLPERIRITDLRTAHLQTFIDARSRQLTKQGNQIAPATVRRELIVIMATLNSAYLFYPELEIWKVPRKPPIKIQKQPRQKVISQSERAKIFAYLFGPAKDGEKPHQTEARKRTGYFLQFCLLTASRPGEVAKIRKQDVDFDSGLLKIYGTKTRYKASRFVREIKLTPTMKNILLARIEAAEAQKTDFLFTRSGSITPIMRDCLKSACEAHGIAYGRNKEDGIIFHTARHTSTTELARSNQVDVKTAGAFTGHSDETMTLYYTHTNEDLLKIAGEVLEQNFGGNVGGKNSEPVQAFLDFTN